MSLLDRVRACNDFRPEEFMPFMVDGLRVGQVRHSFLPALERHGGMFECSAERVVLSPELQGFETRTHALRHVAQDWVARGDIAYLLDEEYPVTSGDRERPLFLVNRAIAACFGIRAYGQHLNGYVRRADGLYMWLGRRAADRRIFPSRLDNLVAGGLPHGISLADNLAKECREEAGISRDLALKARPVGAVTYNGASAKGYKPDILYCYDLELGEDFRPQCTDGEVEEFLLLRVEEVLPIVADSEDFKPNCNLVVIDFLIRHGYIAPDEPDYLALQQGLHSRFALDEPQVTISIGDPAAG